jgi:hypothetical protein
VLLGSNPAVGTVSSGGISFFLNPVSGTDSSGSDTFGENSQAIVQHTKGGATTLTVYTADGGNLAT